MGAWGIEMRQSDEGLDIMSSGFKPDKNGSVDIDAELRSCMLHLIQNEGFNKNIVLDKYRDFMLAVSEIVYELNRGNALTLSNT